MSKYWQYQIGLMQTPPSDLLNFLNPLLLFYVTMLSHVELVNLSGVGEEHTGLWKGNEWMCESCGHELAHGTNLLQYGQMISRLWWCLLSCHILPDIQQSFPPPPWGHLPLSFTKKMLSLWGGDTALQRQSHTHTPMLLPVQEQFFQLFNWNKTRRHTVSQRCKCVKNGLCCKTLCSVTRLEKLSPFTKCIWVKFMVAYKYKRNASLPCFSTVLHLLKRKIWLHP